MHPICFRASIKQVKQACSASQQLNLPLLNAAPRPLTTDCGNCTAGVFLRHHRQGCILQNNKTGQQTRAQRARAQVNPPE